MLTRNRWVEVKMNMVQRGINSLCVTGAYPPGALLTFAHILLRGGEANDRDLCQDYAEWVGRYGEPTDATVDAWAATLNIEAGIAERVVRAMARQAE